MNPTLKLHPKDRFIHFGERRRGARGHTPRGAGRAPQGGVGGVGR